MYKVFSLHYLSCVRQELNLEPGSRGWNGGKPPKAPKTFSWKHLCGQKKATSWCYFTELHSRRWHDGVMQNYILFILSRISAVTIRKCEPTLTCHSVSKCQHQLDVPSDRSLNAPEPRGGRRHACLGLTVLLPCDRPLLMRQDASWHSPGMMSSLMRSPSLCVYINPPTPDVLQLHRLLVHF